MVKSCLEMFKTLEQHQDFLSLGTTVQSKHDTLLLIITPTVFPPI